MTGIGGAMSSAPCYGGRPHPVAPVPWAGRPAVKVQVEICVTSFAEAEAAQKAGADSIEVCSGLDGGGSTPSFGTLNFLQERLTIRKRVLVRPGPGGFQYSADERQVLLRDVMMSGIGDKSCGIVSGALDTHGLPDVDLIKGIILAAAEREFTFHRAVDVSSDPIRALEACMLLGVQRVLTSGGASSALDGASVLAEFVRRAKGRMAVAAAAGIGPANVVEIVERTGVEEVHFSAQLPAMPVHGFGSRTIPDIRKIEGVLEALGKAGLR